MRISDWSSDVCSSDLAPPRTQRLLEVCAIPEPEDSIDRARLKRGRRDLRALRWHPPQTGMCGAYAAEWGGCRSLGRPARTSAVESRRHSIPLLADLPAYTQPGWAFGPGIVAGCNG